MLYKHIIQVENKNMGLKVRGGGAQTYHSLPPPPPPPPRFLRQCYSTFNFSANKNRKQNRNSTLFVQTETETETEAKFHNRTSLTCKQFKYTYWDKIKTCLKLIFYYFLLQTAESAEKQYSVKCHNLQTIDRNHCY